MAITLLDMLLNAELLTPAQCDEALQNRVFFGGRIGTNLIELGFIDEELLAQFLSDKLAVPYVEPSRLLTIPPEVIELITPELAVKYQIVPVEEDNRKMYMAMADPLALAVIDEIAFITGHNIRPMIAPEVRLLQALGQYYDYRIKERHLKIIAQLEDERRAREEEQAILEAQMRAEEEAQRQAEEAARAAEEARRQAEEEARQQAEAAAEALWRKRMQRYSIGEYSIALAHAKNRREIADVLIRYLSQEFRCGGLFLIKDAQADGWRAVKFGEARIDVGQITLPLTSASVAGKVVEGGVTWCGDIPVNDDNAPLFDVLCDEKEGLVVPVVVEGRTVILLAAAGSRDDPKKTQKELEKLVDKAALAFGILISRDRILMS